jgi:succinate dehydrogenase flavin-adding protein (antitoxin of CptAB toxin-antitoxin module)
MTFPEKMRTVGVRYKRLFQCLDQDIHVPSILKIEESARYRIPMSNEYWQKTVNTLRHEVSKLDQKKVMVHIDQIIRGIQWLDPIMTRYCEQTCPSCKDPCCTGYEVFFNQTDLLYLTAGHTYQNTARTNTNFKVGNLPLFGRERMSTPPSSSPICMRLVYLRRPDGTPPIGTKRYL